MPGRTCPTRSRNGGARLPHERQPQILARPGRPGRSDARARCPARTIASLGDDGGPAVECPQPAPRLVAGHGRNGLPRGGTAAHGGGRGQDACPGCEANMGQGLSVDRTCDRWGATSRPLKLADQAEWPPSGGHPVEPQRDRQSLNGMCDPLCKCLRSGVDQDAARR